MQNEYFHLGSLEASLEKVEELGLNFVECSLLWFKSADSAKTARLLAKHNVGISAINTWASPQSPKVKEEYVRRGIKMADDLGAKVVVVYFGNLSCEPTIELFQELVRSCLREAEQKGVTLALETEFDVTGKDLTRTAEGILQIMGAVDSECLGVNFDPGNVYIAGGEPYPYSYELLKDHIRYVHLKDAARYHPVVYGPEKNHSVFEDLSGRYVCVPLGEGATNCEGFLNRLSKDGYDGFITLEPHVARDSLDATFRKGLVFVREKLGLG